MTFSPEPRFFIEYNLTDPDNPDQIKNFESDWIVGEDAAKQWIEDNIYDDPDVNGRLVDGPWIQPERDPLEI